MKWSLQVVWGVLKAFPMVSIIGVTMVAGQLTACESERKIAVKTPTTTTIQTAKAAAGNQKKTLTDMSTTVDGLTPQNVPNQKPLLQGQVSTAKDQNQQITAALGTASKSAKVDEATLAAASDPIKVRLQQFGYSSLVLGIIATVVGIVFSGKLGIIADWLRSGGVTAVIVGVLTLAVAYIIVPLLHALFWVATILVGVGLAGAGLWVYLHRNQIIPSLESIATRVEGFFSPAAQVKKDVA